MWNDFKVVLNSLNSDKFSPKQKKIYDTILLSLFLIFLTSWIIGITMAGWEDVLTGLLNGWPVFLIVALLAARLVYRRKKMKNDRIKYTIWGLFGFCAVLIGYKAFILHEYNIIQSLIFVFYSGNRILGMDSIGAEPAGDPPAVKKRYLPGPLNKNLGFNGFLLALLLFLVAISLTIIYGLSSAILSHYYR